MRGRFLMMAMATVHARASEHVYGVEERLATRDAEVGMQGEDEAVGARTCTGASSDMPGRAHRVPGKVSGESGRACSGQCQAVAS
jgi:hypothetical protein